MCSASLLRLWARDLFLDLALGLLDRLAQQLHKLVRALDVIERALRLMIHAAFPERL
jgi:hypothetical protein